MILDHILYTTLALQWYFERGQPTIKIIDKKQMNQTVDGLAPNNPVLVWVCPNGDAVVEEPNNPPLAGLLPKIDVVVVVVGVPNNTEDVVVVAPKPVEAKKKF